MTACAIKKILNMADNPELDLAVKEVVPLDADDIALLKSYVRNIK